MISAVERVFTSSGGVLSCLATFVLIEIDTLNRAGRASTEAAFRQLAETYMRSAPIRSFTPQPTGSSLSPRCIVRETFQAIHLNPKQREDKPKPHYYELDPTHLESEAKVLTTRPALVPFFVEDPFFEEEQRRKNMLGIFQRFI